MTALLILLVALGLFAIAASVYELALDGYHRVRTLDSDRMHDTRAGVR
jgi:hypothetical protein